MSCERGWRWGGKKRAFGGRLTMLLELGPDSDLGNSNNSLFLYDLSFLSLVHISSLYPCMLCQASGGLRGPGPEARVPVNGFLNEPRALH